MGYRSDVRMVIQGPKELILTGFAALALTGDSVMQEALKEWDLKEDGVQVTVGAIGAVGRPSAGAQAPLRIHNHAATPVAATPTPSAGQAHCFESR